MKKIFTLLLIGSTLLLSSFISRSGIDDVIDALRSGNSSELVKHFGENLEVTLPDKSDNYSKAQAQLIVKDFFKNNGVKAFELKNKGDTPNGHYCIGSLQTNSGSFRTYVRTKANNGKELIEEIRFQAIE